MNKMDSDLIDHYRLDLENRMRNLLWTVSGDYTLDFKPDVSLFQRSKAIALYDGIKQGALAAYFDKEALGMYLVKKIFLGADEESLVKLAQLCIEESIGERICKERPGVRSMQNQAFVDILEQEFEEMPSLEDNVGRLKAVVLRDRIDGKKQACDRQLHICRELLCLAGSAKETLELIEVLDKLYNFMIDPMYEKKFGSLEKTHSYVELNFGKTYLTPAEEKKLHY